MDLSANIKGIKYKPLLCRKLEVFNQNDLEKAINSYASFILEINQANQVAISWWVSSKRTRSYPYARVYDTMKFSGKKISIIPVFKDEGIDGERDFLQWDTISLMSLFGIYVIIAYYDQAERSERYRNKITNQRFSIDYLRTQIINILSYQSDSLHWNLDHINDVGRIGKIALEKYEIISKTLNVKMHSHKTAEKRINKLLEGRDEFIKTSRSLAARAQLRERLTIQPRENLSGSKSIITIKNYLGGNYFFTSDEAEVDGNNVLLIEGKYSKTNSLPSLADIKDGIFKMILFTNLEDVTLNNKIYYPIPILKLSVKDHFDESILSDSQKEILSLLREEAKINNFKLILS